MSYRDFAYAWAKQEDPEKKRQQELLKLAEFGRESGLQPDEINQMLQKYGKTGALELPTTRMVQPEGPPTEEGFLPPPQSQRIRLAPKPTGGFVPGPDGWVYGRPEQSPPIVDVIDNGGQVVGQAKRGSIRLGDPGANAALIEQRKAAAEAARARAEATRKTSSREAKNPFEQAQIDLAKKTIEERVIKNPNPTDEDWASANDAAEFIGMPIEEVEITRKRWFGKDEIDKQARPGFQGGRPPADVSDARATAELKAMGAKITSANIEWAKKKLRGGK